MMNDELEQLAYSVNDLVDTLFNAPDDVIEYVIDIITSGGQIDIDEFISLFGEPENDEEEEE